MKYEYTEMQTASLIPVYKLIDQGWEIIEKIPRRWFKDGYGAYSDEWIEGFYVTLRRANG